MVFIIFHKKKNFQFDSAGLTGHDCKLFENDLDWIWENLALALEKLELGGKAGQYLGNYCKLTA